MAPFPGFECLMGLSKNGTNTRLTTFSLANKDVKHKKHPTINDKIRSVSYFKDNPFNEVCWCLWKIHCTVLIFSFLWESLETLSWTLNNEIKDF